MAITAKQIAINDNMATIDRAMGTSDVPKKLHLKPLIRKNTGLSNDTFCQNSGNISIE